MLFLQRTGALEFLITRQYRASPLVSSLFAIKKHCERDQVYGFGNETNSRSAPDSSPWRACRQVSQKDVTNPGDDRNRLSEFGIKAVEPPQPNAPQVRGEQLHAAWKVVLLETDGRCLSF